jgi:hypothetical protein
VASTACRILSLDVKGFVLDLFVDNPVVDDDSSFVLVIDFQSVVVVVVVFPFYCTL